MLLKKVVIELEPAIINSGFHFLKDYYKFAPADIRKEGSHYDLPAVLHFRS